MQNHIKGKVIVITGAGSGIGSATAIGLAKAGARIFLGARKTAALKEVADEIINDGGEANFLETDVTDKAQVAALANTAVKRFGRLDVFINNAGVSQLGAIEDLDIPGWEEMIDVNLKGVLYGMAAAIPIFKRQGAGQIINIISTSGIKIVPGQGVYAATKNAVRTISEAFRQESDGAIRITGISPGFVKTGFANTIKNQEMKTAILKNMETFALHPEAIANAVIYAINQPDDVEVGDIVIRPAAQK
ncbi:MAG: SDR family oxidoreductase [Chitinophaga sp.]|uniref:SDR family oxidoreductase n=1 Tax=Chitinophaga sp. TaxID=1869181 RepID=UPI001B195E57|nr:SDR family oxidoreductase [Chitinophaga sp.]MBO9729843.1 SDR family oxidoreductase [Chitinophaga sp.]